MSTEANPPPTDAQGSWTERTTKRLESTEKLLKAFLALAITAGSVYGGIRALGSTGEAVPAPAPPSPPPIPAPGPDPDPVVVPPQPVGGPPPDEIVQIYLAAIKAFNAGDKAAYQAAFADELDCFYDHPAPSSLAAERLGSGRTLHVARADLMLLRETPHEVVFCDKGRYSMAAKNGSNKLGGFFKTIVMQKKQSGWKITSEVGFRQHDCHPRSMPLCGE